MTRAPIPTPLRLPPPVLGKAAAVALILLLSACASPPTSPQVANAPLASQQWESRVQVTDKPEEVWLAPHAEGLSARQVEALDGLLSRFLGDEGREIVVNAPVGGPGSDAAGRMAYDARLHLISQGAAPSAVRIVGYDAGREVGAPLKVGYLRKVASIPKCGMSWESLTATRDNEAYANFGCAIAANTAAQIANPEDLIRPRESTPIDAERRDTVMEHYRKGEKTAAVIEEQATGSISKAVQ